MLRDIFSPCIVYADFVNRATEQIRNNHGCRMYHLLKVATFFFCIFFLQAMKGVIIMVDGAIKGDSETNDAKMCKFVRVVLFINLIVVINLTRIDEKVFIRWVNYDGVRDERIAFT